MPSYIVARRNATRVTDGTIREVIQAVTGDRPPRIGETAHVRAGVGAGSEALGSFPIVRVRDVGVSEAGQVILSEIGDVATIRALGDVEADTFARSVGHGDRAGLVEALEDRLPFVGHVIEWDPS